MIKQINIAIQAGLFCLTAGIASADDAKWLGNSDIERHVAYAHCEQVILTTPIIADWFFENGNVDGKDIEEYEAFKLISDTAAETYRDQFVKAYLDDELGEGKYRKGEELYINRDITDRQNSSFAIKHVGKFAKDEGLYLLDDASDAGAFVHATNDQLFSWKETAGGALRIQYYFLLDENPLVRHQPVGRRDSVFGIAMPTEAAYQLLTSKKDIKARFYGTVEGCTVPKTRNGRPERQLDIVMAPTKIEFYAKRKNILWTWARDDNN